VRLPHDHTQDLAQTQALVLLIRRRYDRIVAFEVSIAILNHIADSRLVLLNNCGHWPPFEKPAEWAAQRRSSRSCGATERDGLGQNPTRQRN